MCARHVRVRWWKLCLWPLETGSLQSGIPGRRRQASGLTGRIFIRPAEKGEPARTGQNPGTARNFPQAGGADTRRERMRSSPGGLMPEQDAHPAVTWHRGQPGAWYRTECRSRNPSAGELSAGRSESSGRPLRSGNCRTRRHYGQPDRTERYGPAGSAGM